MAAPDQQTVPIICGPTGSGKTDAAIALSRDYPVEIVSADSRQIIKHLDIGTAKPTAEERRRVTFHLLDLVEPGERYSAFRFIDDANAAIKKILSLGHVPLVVGGTGLYLRALSDGVVEIESDDHTVRERLEREAQESGPKKMHDKLRHVDPEEADRIHPNNLVRVIRALEIYHLTGKPKSELIATGDYRRGEYACDYYCLMPGREELYRAIDDRVDRMMAAGLLQELQALAERGYLERIRKANVIGYTELLEHLLGNFSLAEAVSLIKQNSRRYAKRQVTWFKKQPGCRFFEDGPALIEAVRVRCDKLLAQL